MSKRDVRQHITWKYAALTLLLGYGFASACATDDATFGNGTAGGATVSSAGASSSSDAGGTTNSAGGNNTGGTTSSSMGGNNTGGMSNSSSSGNGMCGSATCGPNDLCCANTYCYPASCSVCCQGGQGGSLNVSSSVSGVGGFITSGGGGGVTCGNMTCQSGWNCCSISGTFYCLPTQCP